MASATAPAVERLPDLVSIIQTAEGFPELRAALRAERSGDRRQSEKRRCAPFTTSSVSSSCANTR
jgi:hypothetical protein